LQRAVVLVFIGGKMLAAQWYYLPVHVSLGIVGLILLVAIAASLVRPARHST
jgi:tellurite resistance protein TerC